MFLIFDTETSNLPQDNIELDHPCQARVMQLACILLDEKLNELGSLNTLLKIPEYVDIHPGAYNKHKITKERAIQYGIGQVHALNVFMNFFRAAEVVVGFGLDFDIKMLDIEYQLILGEKIKWEDKRLKCLMKISTLIVQLPFANGKLNKFGQKYKWPKLEEAYAYFTHKLITGAHNANDDVKSTVEIMKVLTEEYQIVF